MQLKVRLPVCAAITMACCVALLALAACLPRAAIQRQSEASARYFAERPPFDIPYGDLANAVVDNYSDTVLCDIAYCIDAANPLASALQAPYAQKEDEDAYEGYLAVVSGQEEPNREYGRYWHGSLVLVRPLLTVVPIQTIRVLFGAATALLQLAVIVILLRRKHTAFAVCYLLGFMLVHPWMLLTSLEYSTAFLTASAATVAVLLRRHDEDGHTMPFFACVGVVTCFVDFLTTETLTFTLPMLVVLVERAASQPRAFASERCASVVRNGLCWFAGYAAMFALKIGLLAATAGFEVVRSSLEEGLFRLGGTVQVANVITAPAAGLAQQLSGAIWHNLACLYPVRLGLMQAWQGYVPTAAILLVSACAVYLMHDKVDAALFLPMGLLAAVPYVRFLALSNHSYIHFFITYRAQMVTIVALLFLVYQNTVRQALYARRQRDERKGEH